MAGIRREKLPLHLAKWRRAKNVTDNCWPSVGGDHPTGLARAPPNIANPASCGVPEKALSGEGEPWISMDTKSRRGIPLLLSA